MEVSFTDNITTKLVDTLSASFARARIIRVAVAFAKLSGYSLIEKGIKDCLENGGDVEFLVGLDFRMTEPQVLNTLLGIRSSGLSVRYWCFSDAPSADTPVYHPKLYLLDDGEWVTFSIGSSNLTRGGLRDNVEVNAVFTAGRQEEVVSDAYGLYTRLKFGQERFVPDAQYIEQYSAIYRSVQKKSRAAFREESTARLIRQLKEKEKTLPRPKPSGQELFGWQKVVLERLPPGMFKTSDLYGFERDFQQHYPQNHNIRAKTRQILQQLRDIGLLKNPHRNRWERV